MKKIISLLSLLLFLPVFSQSIPTLKIKEKKDLKLTDLKINIEIVGNYAKTTYDMMFYNPHNRVLEGELVFPLAQGQSVSNFAMEVNGKLREAVVVEKTKARVAYKNTMSQLIDPGLLEKTEGNNYKARIYPIAAKSLKHILISTEELLSSENGEIIYNAPLNFNNIMSNFEISISVASQKRPYFQPNPFAYFGFKKRHHKFIATWSKKNYKPNHAFKILIPETLQEPEVTIYRDYFSVYIPMQKNYIPKPKPKHIAIYWDASLSGMYRNIKNELDLLLSYTNYLQDVDIDLFVFSSRIQQKHRLNIKKGKTNELKKIINSIVYDGGTSFALLNNINTQDCNEILLFSDGLNNLGDWKNLPKKPVYTVNSATKAHHDLLEYLADVTGGNYLNLNIIDSVTALDNLKILPLKYLGISENENIFEVFPVKNKAVSGSFVFAGRFTDITKFDVNFGYAGQVAYSYQIDLSVVGNDKLAKRLWAKQKLAFLQTDKKNNKNEIVSLATRYHLISDYTSMIILDRIEDYIKYGIEPPDDLKGRYKELLARQIKDKRKKEDKERQVFDDLQIDYNELLDWYYNRIKKPKKADVATENRQAQERQAHQEEIIQQENAIRQSDGHILHGIVYEKGTNDVMPGANINIKGTNLGFATDFDGEYRLRVVSGDTLVLSFIGYISKKYVVQNEAEKIFYLEADNNVLDAVVVKGVRGTDTNRKRVSYAQQAVAVKKFTTANSNISTEVAGRVTGVMVKKANKNIIVRGATTIIGRNEPLYVMDGKIIKSKKVSKIDPDKIAKILIVRNSLFATTLFGVEGRFGVVLLYSKKYFVKHQSGIEALEKKINDSNTLTGIRSPSAYMNKLFVAKTLDEAYQIYLKTRLDYMNKPAFFIDVSDYFYQKGKKELAIQIISNLADLKLANHELSRALAYKLEAYGVYDMAVKVYQNVLELRAEEPQSYRDLALAYELNAEYQKSFDLLYNMYKGKYYGISGNDNFEGIETVAYVELHHLVNLHGNKIKLPDDAKNYKKPMTMDVRVVVDWNHNDTDIDLWTFDPNNEKIYYSHKLSKIGGKLSCDFMDGYGPEVYSLKKAIKGMYNFQVDYFNDRVQKISGPTILKVTIFKNYGKPNETRKVILSRLDKHDEQIDIGTLGFK